LRRLEEGKVDVDRVPSIDERIQLSYDIFKLENVEMARVLTMIEEACPNALSRKAKADEVLINIDALTPRCFHEVNAYVLPCVMNSSLSNKGKKKRQISGPLDPQASKSAKKAK
jgi:hypothetical protein